MATRLTGPLIQLATFTGPVSIGKFDDGTICVAGPNDQPVLIRDGAVMRINKFVNDPNGDLVFSYEGILRTLDGSAAPIESAPLNTHVPNMKKER